MFKKIVKEAWDQGYELLNEMGVWAIRGAGFTLGAATILLFIH